MMAGLQKHRLFLSLGSIAYEIVLLIGVKIVAR